MAHAMEPLEAFVAAARAVDAVLDGHELTHARLREHAIDALLPLVRVHGADAGRRLAEQYVRDAARALADTIERRLELAREDLRAEQATAGE
jgi:hypothetical protein